jgi:hypothetical protein
VYGLGNQNRQAASRKLVMHNTDMGRAINYSFSFLIPMKDSKQDECWLIITRLKSLSVDVVYLRAADIP